MNQNNTPSLITLVAFARQMRKSPTPSEALLWARLRGRQLGARFRRQHPFAVGIIVDFYCPSYRLVVEVDGSVRFEPERRRTGVARLGRFDLDVRTGVVYTCSSEGPMNAEASFRARAG